MPAKSIFLLFYAIAVLQQMQAQDQNEIDSLLQLVENSEEEKRVDYLNYVLNAYLNSDPSTARSYGKQALELAKKLDFKKGVSASLSNIGVSFELEGDYETALEYYQQALAIDEANQDSTGIANALNNIGIIHHHMNRLDKTLEYWNRALHLREKLGDSAAIAQSLHNIASIYNSQGNYEKAVEMYEETLEIFQAFQHTQGMASCYANLGSIYREQGALSKARDVLKKALSLQKRTGDLMGQASSLNNLGTVYNDLGQLDSSLAVFREALSKARLSHNAVDTRNALYNIAETMAQMGRGDSAYRYLLQHMEVKDSLMNAEKSRQITELETQYETATKERQLQAQALELERANTRNVLLLTICILVVVVSLTLWWWQRHKRRSRLELDRMKSRFIANLIHEFRTPITLIKGPIDEALNGVEDVGAKARLQMAARNTEKLGGLINQVLDISRLESGRMPVAESYGDMVQLVHNTVDYFLEQAQGKNIRLYFESEFDHYSAFFDADKVEKIVSNLLNNALKFTKENGEINVHLSIRDSETPEAILSVEDTGIGIPRNELDKVFDRFHQVEGRYSTEGTGIGLALVKEFSELLGGSAHVSSREKVGTTFTVHLPLQKQADLPMVTEPSIQKTEPTEHAIQHEESIEVLLVEDNVDMRQHVRSLLEYSNILVHEATNGEDGLKLAKEIVPDVVVLDVMMPGMDGLEVCQQLKSETLTDHIPVIMLTAKSSGDSRLAGMEKGADAYIGKPFRKRELITQIQNLVRLREKIRSKFKPETESRDGLLQSRDAFIRVVVSAVEQHLEDEDFSIEQLASELCISRTQLYRKLKAICGLSASVAVRNIRLEKALDLLQRNEGNVTEVAYAVGFGSQPYFSKCFREYFGKSPKEIIAQGIE